MGDGRVGGGEGSGVDSRRVYAAARRGIPHAACMNGRKGAAGSPWDVQSRRRTWRRAGMERAEALMMCQRFNPIQCYLGLAGMLLAL